MKVWRLAAAAADRKKRRLPLRNKLFEGVFYFQNEIDSSLTFSTPDSICEETNEEKIWVSEKEKIAAGKVEEGGRGGWQWWVGERSTFLTAAELLLQLDALLLQLSQARLDILQLPVDLLRRNMIRPHLPQNKRAPRPVRVKRR